MKFMEALQRVATDDPERCLLEGFLAGRDMLPEVPIQKRLL